MIEDGTGIRHHAKAFGDVGTVIPPIILYLKAEVTGFGGGIGRRVSGR